MSYPCPVPNCGRPAKDHATANRGGVMTHDHVSVACQFDEHDVCSASCRFCVAACACQCHEVTT